MSIFGVSEKSKNVSEKVMILCLEGTKTEIVNMHMHRMNIIDLLRLDFTDHFLLMSSRSL